MNKIAQRSFTATITKYRTETALGDLIDRARPSPAYNFCIRSVALHKDAENMGFPVGFAICSCVFVLRHRLWAKTARKLLENGSGSPSSTCSRPRDVGTRHHPL